MSYFKAHEKDVLPVTTKRSFLIHITNKLIFHQVFLVYSWVSLLRKLPELVLLIAPR